MDHVANAVSAGTVLQEARLAKGYTLEDLAIATGLTTDDIDRAERGVPVHEQHVERIEHALR